MKLRTFVAAVAVGATALVTGAVVAAPASARPPGLPYVQGNQTVPVYSYTNAIRESVWVNSSVDSDNDGQPDRIAVDIMRPREAAAAHVKVPVIMDASPYYQCCGRGNQNQLKGYDANGVIDDMPLYYDNYFVPRGYAMVQVDLAGTSRSTGCSDVGGPAEVLGVKAVIDWLNGRGHAYYADGTPASPSWTNGKVGMIGKSWDGTMANGVAATGVDGLKTIVPISAISSWYDYERFNGVLRSPDYPTFLSGFVNGRPDDICAAEFAANQAAADDATGNFNTYWAQRDYRFDTNKVKASVFVVHGINDQNVTTNQFGEWWDELAARNIPRKIWLHQDSHVDPFDIRRADWVNELHRWFDYWLQGVHNGVMNEPQASIQQPNGTWVDQPRWPAIGAFPRYVPLGNGNGTTGVLNGLPSGSRAIVDNPRLSDRTAAANPTTAVAGRAVFLSGTLPHSVRISGNPSVTLRIQVDKPTTEITARLVDYGTQTRIDYDNNEGIRNLSTQSCWGESSPTDSACYIDTAENYITSDTFITARGWLDAAHYQSLWRQTPLQPGRWYTVTVPLDTYDELVPAGHVLGLVLTLSDEEHTSPTTTGATMTVDLARSFALLPIAGAGLPFTWTAPSVKTALTPQLAPGGVPDKTRPRFQ